MRLSFEGSGFIFSESDVVQLEMNEITLSALNTQTCIAAIVQAKCEDIRNLTFELNWSDDPMYSVNFQQHTLSITCQKQQGIEGGVSPMTPTGPGTYSYMWWNPFIYSGHHCGLNFRSLAIYRGWPCLRVFPL